ncbi:hypothetical protein ABBQ38_004956 [Trebouxia sp. C0009 RCD-2024]
MPPAAASRVTRMRNDAQGIIVDTEAWEENTRLHLSVHIRLPVLSNILASRLLTHFHMALILAYVAPRGSASGHFVWPEDLLLVLVHAELQKTSAEGLQTLIRSGLRVCL